MSCIVLMVFKSGFARVFHDCRDPIPGYHGNLGPMIVSDIRTTSLPEAFVQAGQELGFRSVDVNGENQDGEGQPQSGTLHTAPLFLITVLGKSHNSSLDIQQHHCNMRRVLAGFMHTQAMTKGGKRWSTAKGYLRPAMRRKNLHVATLATVTRVTSYFPHFIDWLQPGG